MSRKQFEQSLLDLQENVLSLGSTVEGAVKRSVELLRTRDFQGARELIQQDRGIDEKRYTIEAEALMLIATQAPLARDMRALAAALFIANELERMADYAKGIVRVNLRIGPEPLMKPLIDVPRMADIACDMLERSLQAYTDCDAELARAIIPDDEQVDALYDQVYAELMTLIMQDPSTMRQANLLLMVAHNLERTADRVTNICERVIYVATGQLLDLGWEEDRPRMGQSLP